MYTRVVVFKYLIYAGKYNFHFSKWGNSNQCFQFPSASNFCRESRGLCNISNNIIYISTESILSTQGWVCAAIGWIYIIYAGLGVLIITVSILSTVQGWVCAAIGCVQCTAVFLSSSSICLIAVDRWEICELGLHWWPGDTFGAIINFQQLQVLIQTFRSF